MKPSDGNLSGGKLGDAQGKKALRKTFLWMPTLLQILMYLSIGVLLFDDTLLPTIVRKGLAILIVFEAVCLIVLWYIFRYKQKGDINNWELDDLGTLPGLRFLEYDKNMIPKIYLHLGRHGLTIYDSNTDEPRVTLNAHGLTFFDAEMGEKRLSLTPKDGLSIYDRENIERVHLGNQELRLADENWDTRVHLGIGERGGFASIAENSVHSTNLGSDMERNHLWRTIPAKRTHELEALEELLKENQESIVASVSLERQIVTLKKYSEQVNTTEDVNLYLLAMRRNQFKLEQRVGIPGYTPLLRDWHETILKAKNADIEESLEAYPVEQPDEAESIRESENRIDPFELTPMTRWL